MGIASQRRLHVVSRSDTAAGSVIRESDERFADAPYAEVWKQNLGAPVICVAATPQMSLVAAACNDRTVSLLSAAGKRMWKRTLDNEAWAVAVSADESRIAVGTATKAPASGSVFLFDRAGQERWRGTFDAPVWSIAMSEDGSRMVVGCWDGLVYLFADQDGKVVEMGRARLGDAGVYGVAVSSAGDRIMAAAYDTAVTVFDGGLRVLATHPCATGTYHAALAVDGRQGVVGLRDGRAMLIATEGESSARYTSTLSQRPMCGAAISAGGAVLLGSFDGSAYLINSEGRLVWTFDADGEIWSTALSDDGSFAIVGSGDGTVRVIENRAADRVLRELLVLEKGVERASSAREAQAFASVATAAFRRYGLVDYAVRRLRDWGASLGKRTADELAVEVLLADTAAFPHHSKNHFLLAGLYEEVGESHQAAWHYVWAGKEDRLRLEALTKAGDAFQKAGLDFAAKSSYRRAREHHVSDEAKRTLYCMGRAYEDDGKVADAKKFYEVVFTHSPDYRDVFARLERLSNVAPPAVSAASSGERIDWYDNLLLGLLGPDVPRLVEVDESLQPILRARAKELAVTSSDRRRMLGIVAEHSLDSATSDRPAGLDYDVAAYMRYDSSVPEDEAKKSLELVHALDCVKRHGPFQHSLDIGTATGRYPSILAGLNVEAFGIDVEPEAIQFARHKVAGRTNPRFELGDARAIPFADATFDLITCMMGTAAHFPGGSIEQIFAELRRCLRPGGILVVSTWDVECPHLTFLSLYSQAQKEEMRRNSLTRSGMQSAARRHGFEVRELIPIGLLPEGLAYELDLQHVGGNRIVDLVDVELAFRALFPALHGQMFMMVAQKA